MPPQQGESLLDVVDGTGDFRAHFLPRCHGPGIRATQVIQTPVYKVGRSSIFGGVHLFNWVARTPAGHDNIN
jgi:hypothetical protein